MFYHGVWCPDVASVRRLMEADGVRVAGVTMLDGTRLTMDLDDPLVDWMLV